MNSPLGGQNNLRALVAVSIKKLSSVVVSVSLMVLLVQKDPNDLHEEKSRVAVTVTNKSELGQSRSTQKCYVDRVLGATTM